MAMESVRCKLSGKIMYSKRKQALKGVAGVKWRTGGAVRLRVYRCQYCNQFHLATSSIR